MSSTVVHPQDHAADPLIRLFKGAKLPLTGTQEIVLRGFIASYEVAAADRAARQAVAPEPVAIVVNLHDGQEGRTTLWHTVHDATQLPLVFKRYGVFEISSAAQPPASPQPAPQAEPVAPSFSEWYDANCNRTLTIRKLCQLAYEQGRAAPQAARQAGLTAEEQAEVMRLVDEALLAMWNKAIGGGSGYLATRAAEKREALETYLRTLGAGGNGGAGK